MKYTTDLLKQYFEMTLDMDAIGLRVFTKIQINNPEVLTYGQTSMFDEVHTNQRNVIIRYLNPVNEEIEDIVIPFEVWCNGENAVYTYIVYEWNKNHNPLP